MIKGFGDKTKETLKRHNINTYKEFLLDFPISYELVEIVDEIKEGYYVRAKFYKEPFFKKVGPRTFTFFTLELNNKRYNCAYFGLKIYYADVKTDTNYLFKVKLDQNSKIITILDFLPDSPSNFVITKYRFHLYNRLNLLKSLIKSIETPKDIIPNKYIKLNNLLNFSDYIIKSHFPKDATDLQQIFLRREYEVAFIYFTRLNNLLKTTNSKHVAKPFDRELLYKFINSLPFKLTHQQSYIIDRITSDFWSDSTFQKLVEGDVGTGKTIIAISLAYVSYLQNLSSILVAPTEILARQHYDNALKYLSNFNVSIRLIIGSTSKKEKQEIYEFIKTTPTLLISTHAVFYQDFQNSNNVGLIQIDEQHRFGVKQRSYLKEQFPFADVIYYSATPIPRSLSIFMFDENNILCLREYPKFKKPVITKYINFADFYNMTSLLVQKVKHKEQVIIICPRIINEDDKEDNLINLSDVKSLLEPYIDPSLIAFLHGKMKSSEKDLVYQELNNLSKLVLIATSVVEVGFDLKNASHIFILNAERYGLAQLHQLRGRVGRGELQGYCYLVSDLDLERLRYLENVNDGFLIAEYDLKIRGAGNIFGLDQHGHFNLVNLECPEEIRNVAYLDSKRFLMEASKEELDEILKGVINYTLN